MSNNRENSVSESPLDSGGQCVRSEEDKETCKGKSMAASLTHPREDSETVESLLDTQAVNKELERDVRANITEETKQEIQPYIEDTKFYDENTASVESFDPGLDLETPSYLEEKSDELENMSDSDTGDDNHDIEQGVDACSNAEDGSEVSPTSRSIGEEDAAGRSEEEAEEEVLPGGVQILGIGGDPQADLAESEIEDEEEMQGESTLPEIYAEPVDREEEERRIEERVTRRVEDQIIHDAPIAEVQSDTCSLHTKRRVVLGGIAFMLLAIAVGVSLGMTLPREEPTQPLNELLSSVSFDGGEALLMPSTPQNMAYKWLANNTNLDTYTNRRKVQRYTLASLYFSTNGTDWLKNMNWLSDTDECGIWKTSLAALVCTDDEEILELDLSSNNLVGSIPPEIALLTSMTELSLYDNELSGSIPTEIGYLTNMTELVLFESQLPGPIPTEIGSLTAMTDLYLGSNKLTGPIPSEIGGLTTLAGALDLGTNKLIGSIPSEIGSLSALGRLFLEENQLSGSIPSEIGGLNAMTILLLYENDISKSVPTEIGSLTTMLMLDLSQNRLTGTIASIFHSMTNLQYLYLFDNEFTGNFSCPEHIWDCWVSCEDPDYLVEPNETCRSL